MPAGDRREQRDDRRSMRDGLSDRDDDRRPMREVRREREDDRRDMRSRVAGGSRDRYEGERRPEARRQRFRPSQGHPSGTQGRRFSHADKSDIPPESDSFARRERFDDERRSDLEGEDPRGGRLLEERTIEDQAIQHEI